MGRTKPRPAKSVDAVPPHLRAPPRVWLEDWVANWDKSSNGEVTPRRKQLAPRTGDQSFRFQSGCEEVDIPVRTAGRRGVVREGMGFLARID